MSLTLFKKKLNMLLPEEKQKHFVLKQMGFFWLPCSPKGFP